MAASIKSKNELEQVALAMMMMAGGERTSSSLAAATEVGVKTRSSVSRRSSQQQNHNTRRGRGEPVSGNSLNKNKNRRNHDQPGFPEEKNEYYEKDDNNEEPLAPDPPPDEDLVVMKQEEPDEAIICAINPLSIQSSPSPGSPAGSLQSTNSGSGGSGGGGGNIPGSSNDCIYMSSSRRIFRPEFKQKVLDAFANDPEFVGNQRATARKFGIHRRQVQKWLQQLTSGELTFKAESNAQSTDSKSIEHVLANINGKLSILQSLDEEHIKRLDSIESRMNRIQVANHEKSESIRSELRNFVRKFDTIGAAISNIDTSLKELKSNDEDTKSSSTDSHKLKSRSVPQLDVDQKLDALATLLTSTRSAVGRIEKGLLQLQSNFTHLQASTKTIHHFQRHIPTKQFLNNILQNARTQLLPSSNGEIYPTLDNTPPSSCSHVDESKTGIYQIQLNAGTKPFYFRCEETSENKWTVILNRFSGATNFYRNWLEYKNGFGNVATEFWIGLDKLYEITNSKLHELYVVLEDFEGVTKHARYAQFAIGSEKEDYALNVLGEYSGTAGDSLSYHAGSKFSTFDVDNDIWIEGNCAQSHTGGWWYSSCDTSNLNGKYLHGNVSEMARYQGMYWNDFHGPTYSLRAIKMLVKAIDYE